MAPEADSNSTDTPVPAAAKPGALRKQLHSLLQPAAIIAILALLLLGWQWLETRERLLSVQLETTRRLGEGELQDKEIRQIARQTQESAQSLSGRVSALENRLAEAQSQQVALEQMYQELTRSRDERLLAEVDQTVSIAAQQLQIAGNVETALIALQGADARLARSSQAQYLPIRRLLAQDIARLKALPVTDTNGIALRLENVMSAVDTMRMAYEHRPKPEASAQTLAPEADTPAWRVLLNDFWLEVRHLIRVERMDQPAPALLAPSNAFFLRENIKLHLLNARLALLQRDSRTFNLEVRQAHDWLERYFDTREPAVKTAIVSLAGLGNTELNLELPTLTETLTALRNTKLSGGKK